MIKLNNHYHNHNLTNLIRKAKEIAIRMIKAGKMSLEDIADYTELSHDTIRELVSQSVQFA